ncbi:MULTISPECIES: ABC transporter permease [Leeuwenhoekiella]|uniref:ABC transport system permease protein n=1 Tax=Leeuwenhoekiella palythoae TaxID=573501 RepID=A0A1M5ZE92_9FLAO|nr:MULTISPECIES: ABC transporter permease [Leeuwenhoekiella]MEC7782733.1 ABC transporter permease [Bacteroidota bacterium]HBO29356.1 multidrug ABC transporter substrate-binding protein [Leeuwenhoekiella sp.]MEC8682936.1 ABC transporter permease [Bacteroidota bacterium]MEC8885165.1 ABC transporter permease [Bacteroidota bacterium]MEE3148163.1 ABC transporter permease [Bacteroidota bacterium]|tara:strand:+ start:966 stop:2186 length:1221 start_codon:yes stop_codon:yes gene_type:complete
MRILNLLKIAWRAIKLNKMRTFLTMLGIIIGVASVIAMLAVGEGSTQSIKTQISSMGSNMITIRPGAGMQGGVRTDPGEMQSLKLEDYESLRDQATLLTAISPQVSGSGQVISGANNWPSSIYGVTPEYLDIRVLELAEGSMFTSAEVKSAAKVAVIGQTIVENIFPDGESPIGKMIRFNKIPFKVIGVLEPKGENTFGQDQDDIILAPYTAVQKRILAIDYLQSIVASAVNEEQAPDAVEEVSAILRENHQITNPQEDDFNVFSMEELITALSSTSEILTVLLVAIAGISLLIGGIGIMNIMYVSVKERTREIGLRMAVGGKGADILIQFLIEAILISITGGILGVLLGISATLIIQNVFNWPTIVTLYSVIISFAVCAITGIFFGWYPARKAAALDPIVALRYE